MARREGLEALAAMTVGQLAATAGPGYGAVVFTPEDVRAIVAAAELAPVRPSSTFRWPMVGRVPA